MSDDKKWLTELLVDAEWAMGAETESHDEISERILAGLQERGWRKSTAMEAKRKPAPFLAIELVDWYRQILDADVLLYRKQFEEHIAAAIKADREGG